MSTRILFEFLRTLKFMTRRDEPQSVPRASAAEVRTESADGPRTQEAREADTAPGQIPEIAVDAGLCSPTLIYYTTDVHRSHPLNL